MSKLNRKKIWVRLVSEDPGRIVNSNFLQENHKTQKTFNKMQDEFIQSNGSGTLKRLNFENIHENRVCVCYWQDNTFYRARILKCDYIAYTALVKYIDFGNEESIEFNR